VRGGSGREGCAAPLFAPGTTLASRYRLVRFIAAGGMGEVYEAEDLMLGIEVAHRPSKKDAAAGLIAPGNPEAEGLVSPSDPAGAGDPRSASLIIATAARGPVVGVRCRYAVAS
jgi:hypothetical protein